MIPNYHRWVLVRGPTWPYLNVLLSQKEYMFFSVLYIQPPSLQNSFGSRAKINTKCKWSVYKDDGKTQQTCISENNSMYNVITYAKALFNWWICFYPSAIMPSIQKYVVGEMTDSVKPIRVLADCINVMFSNMFRELYARLQFSEQFAVWWSKHESFIKSVKIYYTLIPTQDYSKNKKGKTTKECPKE